jgi:AcrR family transcriptional regulator
VPLRRDDVVAAAIRATERGELASLTMRGLADRLGVSPMALYAHVDDKDDLLDEVLDYVLRRDAAPVPVVGDRWQDWMVEFAERLHQVLSEHPVLLDRYCRSPVGVPGALARMEAALAVLADAGFDDRACVDLYAAVQMFTLGFTTLEVARRATIADAAAVRSTTLLDPSSPRYWPALFGSLAPDEFPVLSRLRPDLAEFTSPERFRRGLRCLLGEVDRVTVTDANDRRAGERK